LFLIVLLFTPPVLLFLCSFLCFPWFNHQSIELIYHLSRELSRFGIHKYQAAPRYFHLASAIHMLCPFVLVSSLAFQLKGAHPPTYEFKPC